MKKIFYMGQSKTPATYVRVSESPLILLDDGGLVPQGGVGKWLEWAFTWPNLKPGEIIKIEISDGKP